MRRYIITKNATSEMFVWGRCNECDEEFRMDPDWDGSKFLCSSDCFLEQLSTPESRKKLTKLMSVKAFK